MAGGCLIAWTRGYRWLGWGLLLASMLVLASTPCRADELALYAGQDRYPLAPALQILEDPGRQLTPAGAAEASGYRALPATYYSPGYSRSAWWARWQVRNLNHPSDDWLLVHTQRTVERIEVFVPDDRGDWRVVAPYGEGLGLGLYGRFGYPVFRLALPSGVDTTVLVRIENSSPVQFTLEWEQPYPFFVRERIERLLIGMALTVPVVVALQMLLLWGAMRDPAHLLLAGLQLALLLSSLWLTHYLGEWPAGLSSRRQATLGIIGFNLAFALGLLHLRRFLRLQAWRPHMARALLVLLPWFGLNVALEFAGVQAARLLTLAGAFTVVALSVALSWQAAARHLPFAMPYCWAWAMLLPSALVAAAARLQWVGPQAWGYTHLAGGAAAALVFGFALSAQVAHRERERRDALAKADILAATYHDLRQPLQSLGVFMQLLQAQPLVGKPQELLRRMRGAYRALDDFLDSLLHLARQGRPQPAPACERLAVQSLFDDLVQEYREQARAGGVALRCVPSCAWVWTDRLLLERIVRNLLANALRYTVRGRVLLGCRRRGGRLWIEVHDTGPGIAPAELPRLFDPFVRAGAYHAGGFGLGLAAVRQLAGALGCEVRVHSVSGRGSCFAVALPLA